MFPTTFLRSIAHQDRLSNTPDPYSKTGITKNRSSSTQKTVQNKAQATSQPRGLLHQVSCIRLLFQTACTILSTVGWPFKAKHTALHLRETVLEGISVSGVLKVFLWGLPGQELLNSEVQIFIPVL